MATTPTRPANAPPDWLPGWLAEIYDKPLVQKFWKYSMTSVVGVILGQSLIFLFATLLDWSWGVANVGNVIGFGVLWLAKFFILDRILFKVTHEHIDGPTPFL